MLAQLTATAPPSPSPSPFSSSLSPFYPSHPSPRVFPSRSPFLSLNSCFFSLPVLSPSPHPLSCTLFFSSFFFPSLPPWFSLSLSAFPVTVSFSTSVRSLSAVFQIRQYLRVPLDGACNARLRALLGSLSLSGRACRHGSAAARVKLNALPLPSELRTAERGRRTQIVLQHKRCFLTRDPLFKNASHGFS